MKTGRLTYVLTALALASACRSAPKAVEVPPPRVDWGTSDVDSISKAMVDDLLDSPQLSYVTGFPGDDLRAIAYTAGVSNETHEPIENAALMAAVERLMIASGRFRFVLDEDPAATAGGPRRQARVDAEAARERASALGAEIVIYAVLRASKPVQADPGEAEGQSAPPAYSLELLCLDVENGQPLWRAAREVSPADGDLFRSH